VHHGGGVRAHSHPVATNARSLLAVGFAGGMVPSPSALVVLLGGIALGRAWFSVLLVIAYGVGMALALVGTGLGLVYARDRIERWASARERAGGRTPLVLSLGRALPALTAGVVIVVGFGLAVQAVIAM
jgi:ABC-type nickel/cobalt efflux system permease component RcnA